MNVELPDGTILQDVPEGTTKEQLRQKLARNGYDVRQLDAADVDPRAGMGRGEKFLVGAGAAADRAKRGIMGLLGMEDQQGADDAQAYAKNHPGGWATAGEIGADIAMTALPAAKIAQGARGLGTMGRIAANVGGNAAVSAAIAPEDRGIAALGGGVGAGLGMALGRVLPLATSAGRAATRERIAGRVLIEDLGGKQAAGKAAGDMERYLAGRAGSLTEDVPLTAAQTLRQAEGATPGLGGLALSKRQLGVSGVNADVYGDAARIHNEGLHGALAKAGADAGGLESAIAAREATTAPMRETALHYAGQVEDIAAPIRAHVNAILDETLPGSPTAKLAEFVRNAIAQNPSPANLYQLKKILTDKLYAPNAPGLDEFTALVKGNQRDVVQLTKLIDKTLNEASATSDAVNQMHIPVGDRTISGGGPTTHTMGEAAPPRWGAPESNANQRNLFNEGQVDVAPNANVQLEPGVPQRRMTSGPQRLNEPPPDMAQPGLLPEETSPGRWNPYLKKYQEMSLPVSSARAQGAIAERLNPTGGPMVGELPELTRNRLNLALEKEGTSKAFGTDKLTPEARARYDELMKFMQRNEEVMRTDKIGGAGGSGSQTNMQGALATQMGPSALGLALGVAGMGHAGASIGLARGLTRIVGGDVRAELARMLLKPEATIKGINAALQAGRQLSPAQNAFRATMTGLTSSAAQPRID